RPAPVSRRAGRRAHLGPDESPLPPDRGEDGRRLRPRRRRRLRGAGLLGRLPRGGPMKDTALNSAVPEGPIQEKWDKHRFNLKLVNPANKRKYDVIVVGTGLAGASAAASLAELGYNVKSFCLQDSPRRAHS